MQIYTGLDYTYKWQYMIKKSIQEAKDNPFITYYFIVTNPRYVEEAFLQYTEALFNIEITTLSDILNQSQSHNKQVLTTLQKIILLKRVLEKNKDSILYQQNHIFTTISHLLPIFDAFYYADTKDITTSSLPPLSQEKIHTCFSLYQQFMKIIPDSLTYSALDTTSIPFTNQVFYIMEDCLLQPAYLSFLEQLDIHNTVSIISNHATTDTRLLSSTYASYFSTLPTKNIDSGDPYYQFLTTQLFSNTAIAYTDSHPFSILKETNPIEEIKSICFSIFQDVVEHHGSYQDYAIYYPNALYLEILQETLVAFSMPFNCQPVAMESPIFLTYLSLLQYMEDPTEDNFITILDYTTLKKCSSFKQVNYYKKQLEETGRIRHPDYLLLQQYLYDTYVFPLQSATTIAEKSTIMLSFLQEELVFDENLITFQKHFTTLLEYKDIISLSDFITLLTVTKPIITTTTIDVIDHIYVCHQQQPISALLPIKKVYIVGMNETVVPKTIKEEGILLDAERKAISLKPYTSDTLSLQQNHFLKMLTNRANTIIFSYAMVTTTNETLLPSSYLLHLTKLFKIPTIDTQKFYQHPSNAHRLYALGGQDPQQEKLNALLAFYIQRKNQPESLTNVSSSMTMSASQLETYNGCPYKYFCQYHLKIQPFSSPILQANEIGTMVHYLIEASTFLFKNRQQAMPLDTQKILSHIDVTMEQYLNKHPQIIYKLSNPLNAFIITTIKEDMFNSLLVLMQQMKASSFSVLSTEEKIQTIYDQIPMKGFVDRTDIFSQYLKVIDYKSSNKELDLSLALQGFNIQMLLYIDILTKQKQLEKGALLYFNTKKRILKSSSSILEPETSENFFKLYQMNGYVLKDVIEEIDSHIDKTSPIIKVRYVKKEAAYKGNVLTKVALEKIVKEVRNYSASLYQEIGNGTIAVKPKASNNPLLHTKVNPCTYCSYQAICNLDVFYNKSELIKNIKIDDFLGGETDADNQSFK